MKALKDKVLTKLAEIAPCNLSFMGVEWTVEKQFRSGYRIKSESPESEIDLYYISFEEVPESHLWEAAAMILQVDGGELFKSHALIMEKSEVVRAVKNALVSSPKETHKGNRKVGNASHMFTVFMRHEISLISNGYPMYFIKFTNDAPKERPEWFFAAVMMELI